MPVKAKTLDEVIDEFAVRFLERIQPKKDGVEAGITLEQELQIFKELTRWASIKHKINPDGGDGAGIDEIARKLGRSARGDGSGREGAGDADGQADAGEGDGTRPIYTNGRGRKNAPDPSGIGSGIQALIAKKPPHDGRGSGEDDEDLSSDSDDLGPESASADGDGGGICTGVPGSN